MKENVAVILCHNHLPHWVLKSVGNSAKRNQYIKNKMGFINWNFCDGKNQTNK